MKPQKLICLAALLVTTLSPALASTQCEDAEAAKVNVMQVDQDIEQLRSRIKANEAVMEEKINAVSAALQKRKKWRTEDHTAFFAVLPKTDEFLAFEKEKRLLLNGYMMAAPLLVHFRQKGDFKLACLNAEEMRKVLGQIAGINIRQFEWMLGKIVAVEAEK